VIAESGMKGATFEFRLATEPVEEWDGKREGVFSSSHTVNRQCSLPGQHCNHYYRLHCAPAVATKGIGTKRPRDKTSPCRCRLIMHRRSGGHCTHRPDAGTRRRKV